MIDGKYFFTTHTINSYFNLSYIDKQKQKFDDELSSFVTRWDQKSEKVFIFLFSIISIPANMALLSFFAHKIKSYKRFNNKFAPKLKHVYAANCFNTYFIEICLFDTVICLHLFIDGLFQQLNESGYTHYESIFDVSQFTCKFFIYALHISAAMTGWLTFLLTFNRFMLLFRLRSNRLCINTKYLTLFLFCICTIANVFRLEILYLNSENVTESNSHHKNDLIVLFGNLSDEIQGEKQGCGFNLQPSELYTSEASKSVFWSLILYNIIFSIAPACGNFFLSIYLIKRHSNLKEKVLLNHVYKLNRFRATLGRASIVSIISNNMSSFNNGELMQNENFNINKYTADFFHTCIPCISTSCIYVICYLPHTILEAINQTKPTILFMYLFKARIYVAFLRYLFHGCKFYLLFLVSYKFRKEFLKFLKKSFCCKKKQEDSANDVNNYENKNNISVEYEKDGNVNENEIKLLKN